jgi:hypothetical protein
MKKEILSTMSQDFKPESIRPQLLPKPSRNVVAEVADFCGPELVP